MLFRSAKEKPLGDGQVHPIVRAMNLLNYDAAAIGNHEFNYGLEFFAKAISGAKYPMLSANIYKEQADKATAPTLVPPYTILDREFTDEAGAKHKIRVGVIGFTPPQIMTWDMAHLKGKVFTTDIVEAAQRYVPRMKAEGADIIIASAHSGISPGPRQGMDENAANYLAIMRDQQVAWTPTFCPVHFQWAKPEAVGWSANTVGNLRRILDAHAEHLQLADAMGVTLLMGTDAGSMGVEHGRAMFEEIDRYLEAGLSMEHTLKAATRSEEHTSELQSH